MLSQNSTVIVNYTMDQLCPGSSHIQVIVSFALISRGKENRMPFQNATLHLGTLLAPI